MAALTKSQRIPLGYVRKPAKWVALGGALATALSAATLAQEPVPPLENHPTVLGYFATANQMRARGFRGWIGSQQNDPNSTSGTGNQLYFGGGDYALTDDLQLGLVWQDFSDTLSRPISGVLPRLEFSTLSVQAQYRLYESDSLKIAVEGSVESLVYKSSVFSTLTGPNRRNLIGSVAVPFTYQFSPELQIHVTPAVSVFPNDVGGVAFFGTVPNLTAGLTWKPNLRWAAYGSITVPFGPGSNTIASSGALTNEPIWTVGARYNVTPKVAVDLYATNGFGATPATRILTFLPDGDTPIVGVRLNYTPGYGPGYRSTYRGPINPLSPRAVRLQQDGFTLTAGDTRSPETITTRLSYGTNDNANVGVFFSPDQDIAVEAIYERFANDGSVAPPTIPNREPRLMVGGKLRLLDQNNGDLVSLSLHPLVGRDATTLGVFYFGVPITYQAGPRTAILVNPKVAAWGKELKYGLGLGVNYEVTDGLELIGEVTPVGDGDPAVWAAGMRYQIPNSGISVDAHATNAIGSYGLGTLIGQDSTKFAVGLTWKFGSPVFHR